MSSTDPVAVALSRHHTALEAHQFWLRAAGVALIEDRAVNRPADFFDVPRHRGWAQDLLNEPGANHDYALEALTGLLDQFARGRLTPATFFESHLVHAFLPLASLLEAICDRAARQIAEEAIAGEVLSPGDVRQPEVSP